MTESNSTREAVRDRYAGIARRVLRSGDDGSVSSCCSPTAPTQAPSGAAASPEATSSCCGSGCSCGSETADPDLYTPLELAGLPEDAVLASLGCGNPTALADLRPGEIVLDLGSGGGIDVLLSARRVGTAGKAYGLDMTDEMLDLARRNAAVAGVTNVEFLKGEIEAVPLPDASVDVIISNCVINLSTDKGRVLSEAFRVLKPGGRLAVSDVVVDGPVPTGLRRQMELWVGCIAGALDRTEYLGLLTAAGFIEATIEPTRIYSLDQVEDVTLGPWLDSLPIDERNRLRRAFMSAFIRARKPASS